MVFFIIASIALQVEHHTEGRPLWELIIVLLFPISVYCLMFFSLDLSSAAVWVFIGYYNAIVLTGGFILGIFLSPIIAAFNAYSQDEIFKRINFGIGSIMKKGPVGNGILMFAGIILALIYFATGLFNLIGPLSVLQKTELYGSLILALVSLIWFSYRHTTFNIDRDVRMEEKYKKNKLL